MRYVLLLACVVVLAGCDRDRRVDRGEAPQVGEFVERFEDETSANDRAAELVNTPPVLRGRPAPPVAVEAPGSGPVVVAATGPTTRPVDPYTADYNPASVITIRGPVVGFRRIALSHDRTGLFTEVHVGGEIIETYLGPEGWLANQGFVPEIANRVAITGSRVATERGNVLIIARDAVLGDSKLAIRNADGQPNFPLPVDVDDDRVE